MSLAARLAALILAAIIPLVAVLVGSQRGLYRDIATDVRAETLQQVRFLAGDLSQLADGIRQVQAVLVEMPQIRGRDGEACSEMLHRLVDAQPLTNNILVADETGRIWCDGVHPAGYERSFTIADRGYFRQARSGNDFAIGRFARGRSSGAPVVHFATPVRDETGRFAGVVATAVDLKALAERLDRPNWSEDRATLVTDREGTILVRHPDNEAYVGTRMTPSLLTLLDDETFGTLDTEGTVDGVPRILGYVPPAANAGRFYVGVGVSRAEAYAVLDRANLQGVLVILLAGFAAAGAAWLVANRTVRRPVQQLLAATAAWRAGDLSVRAGLEGRGEIAELGRAFDSMAGELEATLQRKEMLLRELAHRTMNNLQVLGSLLSLQKKSVGDDAARRELDEAAGRVRAMATAYRSLHRTGGGGAVDFGRLLEDLCANVQSSMMAEGASCRAVAMPLVLASEVAMPMALVANELLTNAVKHGGATSEVEAILEPAGDVWRLCVRNRGRPLPPGFDARSATGFGLRMIAVMAGQAGGALTSESRDGWTSFTVTFAGEHTMQAQSAPEPPRLLPVSGPEATG